jgi:hypothetical protein
MKAMRQIARALIAIAALATLLVALSSCGGGEDRVGEAIATPAGIGRLHLGASVASPRAAGLIGPLRKGCELSGTGQMVATLKPPLQGTAVFSTRAAGLSTITVSSGAETQAGVHIGSSVSEARSAYPGAEYNRPEPREPIPIGFIWVGGEYHQRMTLIIDPLTYRVIEIDVPSANLCE